MPKSRLLLGRIIVSLVFGVNACGNEAPTNHHIHNVCDNSTDTIPFEMGMILKSADESLNITVLATEPNPIDRGNNTWTILLSNKDGNAIADATIILIPTMPGHGHGTHPASFTATAANEVGKYQVGPFDLIMPGTWLLTFTVTTPNNPDKAISVGYCIES